MFKTQHRAFKHVITNKQLSPRSEPQKTLRVPPFCSLFAWDLFFFGWFYSGLASSLLPRTHPRPRPTWVYDTVDLFNTVVRIPCQFKGGHQAPFEGPGDRSAGLAPTGHTLPNHTIRRHKERHTKRLWLPNTTVQRRLSIVTTTATGANTRTHQLTRFPRTFQLLQVQEVTDKDSRLRVMISGKSFFIFMLQAVF